MGKVLCYGTFFATSSVLVVEQKIIFSPSLEEFRLPFSGSLGGIQDDIKMVTWNIPMSVVVVGGNLHAL